MTELHTVQTQQDDAVAQDHKRNRKEVIALGFQNKTKGEALFNGISYVGIGYFVVTGVSVVMTWLLNDKFPRSGKAIGNWTEKTFKAPKDFGEIATLFIGGTIASVLPVKWFEDHKPEFVKKFDQLLYSDEQYHNDPKIIEAHKELDELPKQTWLSVLGSRIVAFVATLSVFLAMGSNKSIFHQFTGQSLTKWSVKLGRRADRVFNGAKETVIRDIDAAILTNEKKIADGTLKDIQVIRDESGANHKMGDDRIASRVFSYVGLDALYTLVTSVTLWASTRVFGGLIGKDAKTAAAEAQRRQQKKPHTEYTAPQTSAPAYTESHAAERDTPPTRITSPTHLERVVEPSREAELTA